MKELIIVTKEIKDKPDWWENFILGLPHGRNTQEEYWYEKRDNHLAEWGATLTFRGGQATLTFNTEAQLTAFLLRWS